MSDVNRGNLEGESPLFLAAAHGHVKATDLLLDNGNSPILYPPSPYLNLGQNLIFKAQ